MMPTINKRTKASNDESSDTNAKQKRLLEPIFTNKKDTEELDLRSMTEEDLKLLQKKGKQRNLLLLLFPSHSSTAMILSHSPAHYYLPSFLLS